MLKVAWMFNHYASDPGSVGPTRHHSLARHLPAYGWRMPIIAASTEHGTNRQRLEPGEGRRLETHDGVDFAWVRTRQYSGNGFDRILNMMSYSWGAYRSGMTCDLPPPDVVIGSSVHPLAALVGARVAHRHGVPFVYEFRDLWPETLIEFGAISGQGVAAFLLRRLEQYLCRTAVRVFTPLPHAQAHLERLGVPSAKLHHVANGVDLAQIELHPEPSDTNGFFLTYLGAHGDANNLDNLLDALIIVKHRGSCPNLVVRLYGDGPRKAALRKYADDNCLDFVQFHAPVLKQEVPALAKTSHAFVICVRDLPRLYRHGVCMNKLSEYLTLARPTIASMAAANDPVAEADAGLTVAPESPVALADGIEKLLGLSAKRRIEMGLNGRAHAAATLDFAHLAGHLAMVLDESLHGSMYKSVSGT